MKSKSTQREGAVLLLGAVLYAALYALLSQIDETGSCAPGEALRRFAVALPVALAVLALLLRGIPAALARRLPRKDKSPGKGRFCTPGAFALIFLAYVPQFLVFYPGSFMYDTQRQTFQIAGNAYDTFHPLLHTLLIRFCLSFNGWLGSFEKCAALYSLIQMALLAGCFALACASVARSCSVRAARRCALCFALYPLHMCFAVCATKDVLFSGLLTLTLAYALEAAGQERAGRALLVKLTLCGAGMALLRNNALYAAAVWSVLLLLAAGRRGRRLAGVALLSCALCMAGNAALSAVTGAQKGDLSETLSLPIQQLARARCVADDRLTDEEKSAIDELMPDGAWALYDPTISDPVKFRFDTQQFLSDVQRYAGVYLSVGKKCPEVYLDAVLLHTFAFWYPYSEYRVSGYYLQLGVSTEQLDEWCDFPWIQQRSLLPRVLASISWRLGAQGAMQIPVVGWLFNMGLIVWGMLFFVLRELYAGRRARFAVALLPVLLWGTYLLGPVMAGRYAYPFVCVLPVLAGRPREVEARGDVEAVARVP